MLPDEFEAISFARSTAMDAFSSTPSQQLESQNIYNKIKAHYPVLRKDFFNTNETLIEIQEQQT